MSELIITNDARHWSSPACVHQQRRVRPQSAARPAGETSIEDVLHLAER